MLDLEPEDLIRRSKDLDLREARLQDRERELDEKAKLGRINILDKQIEAKSEVLEDTNTRILSLDKRLNDKTLEIDTRLAELGGLETTKKAALAKLDGRKAELEATITALKSQVDDTNAQITERQTYLDNQEQQVGEAILEWNDRLNQLRFEIDAAQKDLTRVLEDKIRIEAERDVMASTIADWEQKMSDIEYAYNDKAASYRENLRNLDLQVDQKQKWLDEQDTRHALKVRDLDSREKSIQVQAVVNNRKERELSQKERKLRMDYNLAGMEYE